MDDLQTEEEQIEEMRAWWSEYGRYVIAAVLVAVGSLIGFNQYKSGQLEGEVAASMLFESLAEYVDSGKLDEAEQIADELSNDYANMSYAAQSKLAMARLYMDKNRDLDAADALQELLAMRGNKELQHVGRLRLARVFLYQDKAQDVLDLLSGSDSPAFAALYAEVRGDALAALGRSGEARVAYRAALGSSSQSIDRQLVQMKLADLPPPSIEPELQEEAAGEAE